MPPDTRSSRGKVTITLTNPKEEKEEKAKVTVTLAEPEKMVERVVHQLARKFPPESVITIAGAADCGSSSCSTTLAEDSAASRRRPFRLVHEELQPSAAWTVQSYLVSDELDVAIPVLASDAEVKLSSGATVHVDPADVVTCLYGKTGFLELCQRGYYNPKALQAQPAVAVAPPAKPGIALFVQHVVVNEQVFESAVPVWPGQSLIHLADGDLYSVDLERDVRAIFFSEKGLARFTASKFADLGGAGRAAYIAPQALEPGIPNVAQCPTCVVCFRVLPEETLPLALSSAAKAIQTTGEHRISASLFDETGKFICQRSSAGGVMPPTAAQARASPIDSVRYIWIPAARMSRTRKPAQVLRLAPQCRPSPLADGNHADPCLPKDIDVVLFDRLGHEVGAFVADRKPSLVLGSAADINSYLPPYVEAASPPPAARAPTKTPNSRPPTPVCSVDDNYSSVDDESPRQPAFLDHEAVRMRKNQHRRHPAKVFKSDELSEDYAASPNRPRQSARSPGTRNRALSPHSARPKRGMPKLSKSYMRLRNDAPSTDEEELSVEERRALASPSRSARRFLELSEQDSASVEEDDDDLISRRQAYFKPAEIDYAIPLAPGQTQVKLVNGDRLKVDVARTFVVAYDMKGFPLYTIYPDGRRHRWAPNESGVGIHAQDYFIDQELLYAVPISATQGEVLVNDGSVIAVRDENVVTVFYDASGRPAFSYGLAGSSRRRRIRPGLFSSPGVAASVQYVWLIDCADGSDEQFVVPVKGHQRKIQDPLRRSGVLTVARERLTTLFFDEAKTPLYTKLHDGILVSNGLTAAASSSSHGGTDSAADSYQRVLYHAASEESQAGAPDSTVLSVRRGSPAASLAGASSAKPSVATSSATKIIQREVPVRKVEYRDKIVEVPEVHVVEKHVEVEKVEYVTKFVKKKQIVERPVEHVKYVPKIETKIVERVIEIPKVVEVERAEIIEQKISVDNFIDSQQEVVVAHKIIPQIVDPPSDCEDERVECLRLEPELVAVDVYVPKLVRGKLRGLGLSHKSRRKVDISRGHYNSLVLKLNAHLGENYERLPLLKISEGTYPMLNRDAKVTVHQPTDAEILQFLSDTGLITK